LKEEHRLTVFENRELRKIFGPQRDGITWEWRRLLHEELCCLYSSSNIIRVTDQEDLNGRGILHVGGRGEVYTGFWW
jgi:hypothetical protein